MIAGPLLAALAAAAPSATDSATVRAATPLEQAVAYCSFQAAGADGNIVIPVGAEWYQPMAPGVAAQIRAMGKGRMIGRITADLPDIVKRFAQTQPMARQSDLAPMWFDYYSFGGVRPKVWAVSYVKAHACDVMVTGSSDFIAQRDRLIATLESDGWSRGGSTKLESESFWSFAMTKPLAQGRIMTLRAAGLGADASSDGVQMDLQFRHTEKDSAS